MYSISSYYKIVFFFIFLENKYEFFNNSFYDNKLLKKSNEIIRIHSFNYLNADNNTWDSLTFKPMLGSNNKPIDTKNRVDC